jgi:hypothetical protein
MSATTRIALALAVSSLATAHPQSAVAAGRLDSFDGSCSFQGTSSFSPPATNEIRPLDDVSYEGPGTCTGTLNGKKLEDAAVVARIAGPADPGSCREARTALPWAGTVAFADGTVLRVTVEFNFLATEGTITYRGQYSGAGHGHGSFATERTNPAEVAAQCAGAGVEQAPLDLTLVTQSPLVSDSSSDPRLPADDFSMRFSARAASVPTAAQVGLRVHRERGAAKPSPLRTLVLDLPAGARFDPTAFPACQATDEQFRLLGRTACPPDSQVGSGTINVITGFGAPLDPAMSEVTIFNTGDGTVELLTAPGTNATIAIDRGTFTGPGQLTNHPPKGPGGPPDGEVAVSDGDLNYDAPFIRSPSKCPRSGAWQGHVAYSTADGSSYELTSATPCDATAHAPKIRVRAVPARVGARANTRIRVRVTSPHRACVRRATVRVRNIRTRTDANGRAIVIARRLPRGRHDLVASKRGCRSGATTIVAS